MRALALTLSILLAGCWVATPVTYVERPTAVWCEGLAYPDARCEPYYVWVSQGYRYRGVWHGGRYVIRHRVHVRDHRRHHHR